MPTAFLTAEWRDLVMLNYAVDPALLQRYVPAGTELDSFEGKTYVSLVAFRFLKTKLFGTLAVPFHTDFDEVNLRLYVRRQSGEESRRGVVFIAEIVPRQAIASLAKFAYGEKYVCLPMKHRRCVADAELTLEYEWEIMDHWCKVTATAAGAPAPLVEGSLQQFITEHYWGYSSLRGGGSVEYQVEHEPWSVYSSVTTSFTGDPHQLYGNDLAAVLHREPDSAFIAEGSPVRVLKGRRIG